MCMTKSTSNSASKSCIVVNFGIEITPHSSCKRTNSLDSSVHRPHTQSEHRQRTAEFLWTLNQSVPEWGSPAATCIVTSYKVQGHHPHWLRRLICPMCYCSKNIKQPIQVEMRKRYKRMWKNALIRKWVSIRFDQLWTSIGAAAVVMRLLLVGLDRCLTMSHFFIRINAKQTVNVDENTDAIICICNLHID